MQEPILSAAYDGKIRKLFPIFCLHCQRLFYAPKHAGRKFCSDVCYRSNQSAARCLIPIICAWCGASSLRYKITPSKTGLYFCNRECKENAQRIGGLPSIQPPHYGSTVGKYTYRRLAIEAHGASCEHCGYDKYPAILVVHHKDRNRHNGTLDNLAVLCPTCHTEDHYLSRDGFFTAHN